MQYKTSELTGALLDAAVAKAEGMVEPWASAIATGQEGRYAYSEDWALAGPIIERERVAIEHTGLAWRAAVGEPLSGYELPDEVLEGATPLIAAMRSYVAYKLGHFVEL